MRALLIVNPNSTSQDAELLRQIIPILQDVDGLTLHVKHTHNQGHAEKMVSGLTRDDFDLIVALGGDGTVNEVINGLLGAADDEHPDPATLPRLAVIPTGSANVFVRALGFPADPVEATEALAEHIEQENTRRICLGTWNNRWFAVNAGFGLDADVLARVDRARERGFAATPLRYLMVSLQTLSRASHNPPVINAYARSRDGEELEVSEVPVLLASNTNPWTFLGPLPVVTNPENSFDEGLGLFGLRDLQGFSGLVAVLHLFGADRKGRLSSLTKGSTIMFDDAEFVRLSCPSPHRFQADGESAGEFTNVELRSVVGAIEVYVPHGHRKPYERSVREVLRDFIRLS
ncbi:MAG: diacylglycerol kinase family protein [Corynebacterium sp.]|nr:diacylglycerol kinase family protein [Corynebacterium sp.]